MTLLESGSLAAHNLGDSDNSSGMQATIHRGMTVHTCEGHMAGHVAAVVLDQGQQQVTHVLLVQERQLLEYRLIPVEFITQVSDEEILLRIFQPAVDSFSAWHSS